MRATIIRQLLLGQCRDSADGSPVDVPVRPVLMASSLSDSQAALIGSLQLGRTLAVTIDRNIEAALGQRV